MKPLALCPQHLVSTSTKSDVFLLMRYIYTYIHIISSGSVSLDKNRLKVLKFASPHFLGAIVLILGLNISHILWVADHFPQQQLGCVTGDIAQSFIIISHRLNN